MTTGSNEELRGALIEVMEWIKNWSPSFTDDEEWPVTQEKVTRALEAALPKSSPDALRDRKGICDHCKKPVEVRVNEAWHTKGDKIWHEICSYQQQIEQLTSQLAAPSSPIEGLRELSEKATAGEWIVGWPSINCAKQHAHNGADCLHEFRGFSGGRDIYSKDAFKWRVDRRNALHIDAGRIAGMWDYEEGGIEREEDAAFIVACVNYVRSLLAPQVGPVSPTQPVSREQFERDWDAAHPVSPEEKR